MVKCPGFCYKWIPEFTMESTRVFLIIKVVLVILGTSCLFLFENYLDERIFDTGSKITFATMLVVIIFNITVAFLVIVYVPYMWHLSPFWYSLTITLIYGILLIFFSLNGLVFDRIDNVDEPSLDGWTLVHFLAGVWLGYILPFVPMCYVVSIWEVLEAEWTEGLGDGESVSNHVVDVVVAVVGWFITVLLSLYVFPRFECKQTTLNCLGKRDNSKPNECLIKWVQPFKRIPWISARAASCEKCFWDHDWESGISDQLQKSQDHGDTQLTTV